MSDGMAYDWKQKQGQFPACGRASSLLTTVISEECTPAIPAFGKPRQENCKFETGLSCMGRPRHDEKETCNPVKLTLKCANVQGTVMST